VEIKELENNIQKHEKTYHKTAVLTKKTVTKQAQQY